ncbi:MAG: PQQ-dependent sugar dehydrogenase [Myxococcota bacterium]
MTRIAIGLIALVVIGIGACRFLLPERYVVNAPIAQMVFGRRAETPAAEEIDTRLRVPQGFQIGVYAEGISNARFLRFTPRGELLVSQPRAGRVVLVERDADGDGRADGVRTLLADLNRPHGLDLYGPWLYVAESDAIGRIRFDAEIGRVSGAYERLVTDLPDSGNHWTRTLRFGPDGWMYVSVGSSCNACEEEDERRAAILRYRPDGSGFELYATGLRNAVGFDWQPGTGALYATDNGRDLLGDDFPPCELNRVVRGGFYGWPVAHGARVPDPNLGAGQDERIAASIAPAHGFGAHTAPLGITFVRGSRAPHAYQGAALVALHGSWNRSEKSGYKVVSLHWDEDGRIWERDFAVGFERDETVIGRPVDVAEGPDGAFYISDDYAGLVWRVAEAEAGPANARAATIRTLRSPAAPTPPANPLADLPLAERAARTRRGEAIYQQHGCASCHLPGSGQVGVVIKPLERLAARYSLEELAALIATPTPPMPVFALARQERRDLAVYLLEAFR